MITVIDLGISNISSVLNMLRRAGAISRVGRTPEDVRTAERILVPGIGHFEAGMDSLARMGLVQPLRHFALVDRRPLLGICLGMQLFLDHSEEGDCAGLGLIRGRCVRFRSDRLPRGTPIPHMGWRSVTVKKTSKLTESMRSDARFYFVHSFHVELADTGDALLETQYGYPFVAAYEHHNVAGFQFHPEKSHVFGEGLLSSFCTT